MRDETAQFSMHPTAIYVQVRAFDALHAANYRQGSQSDVIYDCNACRAAKIFEITDFEVTAICHLRILGLSNARHVGPLQPIDVGPIVWVHQCDRRGFDEERRTTRRTAPYTGASILRVQQLVTLIHPWRCLGHCNLAFLCKHCDACYISLDALPPIRCLRRITSKLRSRLILLSPKRATP